MVISFALNLASTRGRTSLFTGASAAILVAFLVIAYYGFAPSSRLKAGNFSRIRPGMTRAEVANLLGGLPGDFGRNAGGEVEVGDGSVIQSFFTPGAGGVSRGIWQDDENHFTIFFDTRGTVVAASKMNHFRRHRPHWSAADIKKALLSILR
jgi:hypothetical protein